MTDTPQSEGAGQRRLTDDELLAAVPSGTAGRQATVGLFVLLGLVSFVIVLFWMTDPATLRGRYILVTSVDNAGGVRAGDPVQMQGVNLGRVHDFEMVGPGRVDITLEIEGEWRIPVGSRVTFGEAGLFGGRTILIERGTSEEYYASGDTLPGQGAGGAGLLGSVDELSGQASDVLSSIKTLLDTATIGSVQGTFSGAEQFMAEASALLREQRDALSRLTESLNRSAESVEAAAAAGPDVARAVARADSTMAMLRETSVSVEAAATSLSTILERIEAGDGTLGRLTTDEAELYENINAATTNLNALLEDLRENPNRYINISIF